MNVCYNLFCFWQFSWMINHFWNVPKCAPSDPFTISCTACCFSLVLFAGSVLAVTTADPYADGKTNRFVGICIQRGGRGLGATFVLRNVIEDQGGISIEAVIHIFEHMALLSHFMPVCCVSDLYSHEAARVWWLHTDGQLRSTTLFAHSPYSKDQGKKIYEKRVLGWDKDGEIMFSYHCGQNRLGVREVNVIYCLVITNWSSGEVKANWKHLSSSPTFSPQVAQRMEAAVIL